MRWGQWPQLLVRGAAELLSGRSGAPGPDFTRFGDIRLFGRRLSALASVLTLGLLFLPRPPALRCPDGPPRNGACRARPAPAPAGALPDGRRLRRALRHGGPPARRPHRRSPPGRARAERPGGALRDPRGDGRGVASQPRADRPPPPSRPPPPRAGRGTLRSPAPCRAPGPAGRGRLSRHVSRHAPYGLPRSARGDEPLHVHPQSRLAPERRSGAGRVVARGLLATRGAVGWPPAPPVSFAQHVPLGSRRSGRAPRPRRPRARPGCDREGAGPGADGAARRPRLDGRLLSSWRCARSPRAATFSRSTRFSPSSVRSR